MRRASWAACVAVCLCGLLLACSQDVTVVAPPPTITLNPSAVSVAVDQTQSVAVTVTGGSNTSVSCASSASNVATVTTAIGGCLVTGVAPGSAAATITVTSNGQTYTTSVPVTVNPKPATVTSVSVSPSTTTIEIGGSTKLTPTVAGTGTYDPSVTYQSLTPSVASVDASGNVGGLAAGQAQIVVTSVANPSLKAFATITVVPKPALTFVDVVDPTTAAKKDVSNISGRVRVLLGYTGGVSIPGTPVLTGTAGPITCSPWANQLAFCDFDSAAPNGALDGTPRRGLFPNGRTTFVASASGTQGTQPVDLTINNTSGFFTSVTPSAPNGVTWRGGDIRVTVTPVFFANAGGLPTTVSITMPLQSGSSPGVDLGGGAGKPSAAIPPPFVFDIRQSLNATVEGGFRIGTISAFLQGVDITSQFQQPPPIDLFLDNLAPRITLTTTPSPTLALFEPAVVLQSVLGSFKVGDTVPTRRLPGGHVAAADVCLGQHYHGTVQIDDVGTSYTDPTPGGCGWGLMTTKAVPFVDITFGGGIVDHGIGSVGSATAQLFIARTPNATCANTPTFSTDWSALVTGTSAGNVDKPVIDLTQNANLFSATMRWVPPVPAPAGGANFCLRLDAMDNVWTVNGAPNLGRLFAAFSAR